MTMKIGELSQRSGVAIETIRYYEKQGILEIPLRSASGYRHYTEQAVQQLSFVIRAKQLGFSLKEIKELLSLSHANDQSCRSIKHLAQHKLQDIDAKIDDLQKIRNKLYELEQSCSGSGPATDCSIIEALTPTDTQQD